MNCRKLCGWGLWFRCIGSSGFGRGNNPVLLTAEREYKEDCKYRVEEGRKDRVEGRRRTAKTLQNEDHKDRLDHDIYRSLHTPPLPTTN